MSRTLIQPGNTLTLIAPAKVASGDMVIVGALAGIAAYDAEQGAEVETILTGVHLLPKATGEITAGALVYWDVSESNCVATNGAGNVLLGAAVELAGSSASSVKVRLNGVAIA
jgi:predicted RecA/RadA family phage recombinase